MSTSTAAMQAKGCYSYNILRKAISFYYSESSSSPSHPHLQNQEQNSNTVIERGKEPSPFFKRILIVDDDPDITSALKTVLEGNGYRVHAFNDPMNVVSNYTESGMYDLLIIDVIMPKMDGFELYEKLRKIDNKVKACFITAYDVYSESLREIFPGFEVDCFMKKPIQNEDLLRKVMNAII
jgi:CheY-like chemotaxis protein